MGEFEDEDEDENEEEGAFMRFFTPALCAAWEPSRAGRDGTPNFKTSRRRFTRIGDGVFAGKRI